jgi:hypothetical protein
LRRKTTNLLKTCFHDLRPVVDGKNDVRNTDISKSGDLVLNDGLVGELDKGLGKGEGLAGGECRLVWIYNTDSQKPWRRSEPVQIDIQEGEGECQSHRRE